MKKTIVSIIVCAVMFGGCDSRKNDAGVVKIGAILPLTGSGQVAGNYVRESLKFALKKSNDFGNTNLKLFIEDSKSTPKDAILAYRKLRSQGVNVFVLQMSSVIQTIFPLSAKEDVLLIGIGSVEPQMQSGARNKYLINYLDATTQANLFLANSSEKLFVFYLNDDYGLSIKNAIEKSELSLNKDVKYLPFAQSTVALDLVSTVSIENNDSVVIAGYGNVMVDIAERLLQRNFQGRIMCTPELTVAANLNRIQSVGGNVFIINMPMLTQALALEFDKLYGRGTTIADMLAYNGLMCLAEVMGKCENGASGTRIYDLLRKQCVFRWAPTIKGISTKTILYDAFVEKVFENGRN